MAKARIALAICGWGWILAMGFGVRGKRGILGRVAKPAPCGACTGAAAMRWRCPSIAGHARAASYCLSPLLPPRAGLAARRPPARRGLHGCRARRRIAAGGPVVPWVCGHGAGPGGCDRDGADSVASPIICRSALAIEAHRGVASLANTARYGQAMRLALRSDGCAQPTTSDR